MESSGPSENISDHPTHRWASLVGFTIAILTLTLPLLVIAYYSPPKSPDSLPRTYYYPSR